MSYLCPVSVYLKSKKVFKPVTIPAGNKVVFAMNQLQNYHLFIRNNNIIMVIAVLKLNCLPVFHFYALIKVEQRFEVERSVANEDQCSISAWFKKMFYYFNRSSFSIPLTFGGGAFLSILSVKLLYFHPSVYSRVPKTAAETVVLVNTKFFNGDCL